MRKIIKPFLITLGSLLVLVAIVISIAFYIVFTPERISPIINNQVRDLFSCEVNIGQVELTLFSTFPYFGLQLDDFSLVNPMAGAQSDTLVRVDRLTGVIDIKAFRRNNEVLLSEISFKNGIINAFVDSTGKNNFEVLVLDTTQREDTPSQINLIDLGLIRLNNINLSYVDDSLKINSAIRNLNSSIEGTIKPNLIAADLNFNDSEVFFALNGEIYLNNARVEMKVPAEIIDNGRKISLNKGSFSINDLVLSLDGFVEFDTINGDIFTDLDYALAQWPFETMISMVPVSYLHHLDGVQIDGNISSSGKIKGIVNDTILPLLDVNVILANTKLNYADFPLPLHGINGDVNIFTDLKNDDISYVRINAFEAKTPHSGFSVEGTLTQVLSDMRMNLNTRANVLLQEFKPMIPDTLEMELSGRLQANLHSNFTLSELNEMKLEKMNIRGDLRTSDLSFYWDSLWVNSSNTQLAFALPNPNPTSEETRFTFASIKTGDMKAGKTDNFEAVLNNADFSIELSDFRDTTRLPDLVCSFKMDALSAYMDTIVLGMAAPKGKFSLNPVAGAPKTPQVKLEYESGPFAAQMGKDSVFVGRMQMNTDIIHDESQTDIFLQWLARGFVDMENGHIALSVLDHPLIIPAIKMDFDPENFQIEESTLVIDKSDFNLSGNLNNVLSYFRGDSILRGRFELNSEYIDIYQLMAMTNGLGVEEQEVDIPDTAQEQTDFIPHQEIVSEEDKEFQGPYMVPQGIDFLLSSNLKMATFGIDTAHDILGDVRLADGLLVLDELRFTTDAARMQLTAMYRTPRKNHLFLGMNYHMMDIEIERLLQMIPDIDTLMPMLRSFRGKGEFHMAIETYMDSTYTLKPSTLRGASSIRGQNLVLMDGETFAEIANTLRFTRQAENIVDSLSVEFTIFRNEIDIYPFLIVMDRYRAVVAGRHNFDMSFNYHISVVDSPLPIKLGIDILGDMDNMKYNLARTRYPELYRPARRGAVQSKELELRQMIRDALISRVVE